MRLQFRFHVRDERCEGGGIPRAFDSLFLAVVTVQNRLQFNGPCRLDMAAQFPFPIRDDGFDHGCVIAERVGDALIVLVPQWVPSVFPFHRCRKYVFRVRCPILSQSIRHSGCRHAPFLKGRGRSRPGRSNVTVHGKSPYRSAWTDSGSFRRVSTYSWNVAQSNMPRSRQYRDSASLPSRRA